MAQQVSSHAPHRRLHYPPPLAPVEREVQQHKNCSCRACQSHLTLAQGRTTTQTPTLPSIHNRAFKPISTCTCPKCQSTPTTMSGKNPTPPPSRTLPPITQPRGASAAQQCTCPMCQTSPPVEPQQRITPVPPMAASMKPFQAKTPCNCTECQSTRVRSVSRVSLPPIAGFRRPTPKPMPPAYFEMPPCPEGEITGLPVMRAQPLTTEQERLEKERSESDPYQQKLQYWGVLGRLTDPTGQPESGCYGTIYVTSKGAIFKEQFHSNVPRGESSATAIKSALCFRLCAVNETLVLKSCTNRRVPHVVRLYDFCSTEEKTALFMQNAGQNFRHVFRGPNNKRGQIPPLWSVKNYFIQLLEALRANLSTGVVFGDIKPRNIGIDPFGQVRLFDFGLGFVPPNGPVLARIGTLCFRSPENAMKLKPTIKHDLWSLACVMFELVTGSRLFPVYDSENRTRYDNTLLLLRQCQRLGADPKHLEQFLPVEMLAQLAKLRMARIGDDGSYKVNLTSSTELRSFRDSIVDNSSQRGYDAEEIELFINLLESLLILDPDQRMSPEEALNHPFFNKRSDMQFSIRVQNGDPSLLSLIVKSLEGQVVQDIPLDDKDPCYHIPYDNRGYVFQIVNCRNSSVLIELRMKPDPNFVLNVNLTDRIEQQPPESAAS